MTELLTSAQMRAIEAAAIASGAVTGLELMERAGRGVVAAVFAEWPELAAVPHKAVVLCGPGNNGGDGFVVARVLKEWGWEVEVFLYGDPEKLPPDARVNYERWRGMGEVSPCTAVSGLEIVAEMERLHGLPEPVLYVDGLFGTGLTRPIPKNLCRAAAPFLNGFRNEMARRIAIDLPSGLCSDSGAVLGDGFMADLTVTFQSAKLGHVLREGPDRCGRLVTASIGLEECSELVLPVATEGLSGRVRMAEAFPREIAKHSGHKYAYGHALVLSGPSGRGGAARMAARGALRIGAGLVTLGCPGEAVAENAAQLNAVMLRAIHDADALGRVLADGRINALLLGPGMGVERAAEMLGMALGSGRACVVDADGLTALAGDPGLFGRLHGACVLTPHAGEFARLFPDLAEKLETPAVTGPAYSKVDAAREAAARAGCVVLFKGPDTVIAGSSGACAVNAAVYDRAAPWLATAGSGDVLAGFVAGLLARGFAPMQAAETAAWLHVECARSFGPGLIAEDLPEELPKVFRALGL